MHAERSTAGEGNAVENAASIVRSDTQTDLKPGSRTQGLSIGAVNDPMEQQADSMANRIMRMPESPFVQRKCGHCAEEDLQARTKPIGGGVQTAPTASGASTASAVSGSGSGASTASESVSGQIRSSLGNGQPLPSPARTFMESRFGSDFSGVNIHTGSEATHLSNELNAQAFTVGKDIYFNHGKFSPESSEGKHLLAHELTHTLQQGGGYTDGEKEGSPVRKMAIQRSVKDKACQVHAFDNSNPKDDAVIVKETPNTIGVSSVDDLVTKTNAYINNKDNDCKCVSKLEINGHGTDGYQSVGNGNIYSNDEKALVHDSTKPQLEKLKGIKFCDSGMLLLMGCHVGQGKGKILEKRVSNILPGILIGGAEHYTFGAGMGKKKIVDNEADVDNKKHQVHGSGTPFINSPHVRWYFTSKTGEEYTKGSDDTPADVEMKLKTADKVKVVTPDGKSIKIK
ncbi:eCIS core domain-containing protein [Flavitalea flava]